MGKCVILVHLNTSKLINVKTSSFEVPKSWNGSKKSSVQGLNKASESLDMNIGVIYNHED